MRLDKNGIVFLTELEGLKLKPYLDTKGIPTIGIGSTFYENGKAVKITDNPLSKEEVYHLFSLTATKYEKTVNESIKVGLTQNQFNALFCLCYNIGQTGFKNSTLVRMINSKASKSSIEKAFMMWTKNIELIGRRKKEVALYFK